MKTVFLLSFLLVLSSSFSKSKPVFERTSCSVTETNDLIELTATFDKSRHSKIAEVVNKAVSKTLLRVDDETDTTLTLADGTIFYVKASATKLYIRFNKLKNTAEAHTKIRTFFDEVKESLK
jgi:hypothetical protein